MYYLVLFCRLGVFFSPNPEQMNLELSSSTSPITTTATSPSRPSCQLTLLLLAVKNTNTLKHYKSTSYWNKTESAFEFPSVNLSKKNKINENVGYAYKSYKAISKQHNRINDEILNRLFRRPTPDFSNDYSEMFY